MDNYIHIFPFHWYFEKALLPWFEIEIHSTRTQKKNFKGGRTPGLPLIQVQFCPEIHILLCLRLILSACFLCHFQPKVFLVWDIKFKWQIHILDKDAFTKSFPLIDYYHALITLLSFSNLNLIILWYAGLKLSDGICQDNFTAGHNKGAKNGYGLCSYKSRSC